MFFSKVVPYNMDEFIHYHSIICHHYKWNALNTFRESCNGYDLNLLNTGLILPLRAFYYSGSFPAFYYYPIFLIWKNPLSARFLGMLFLLIQSFILSRLFKLKPYQIFVGVVIFFPYFFQHVVDTGPVGFHITAVILIYALFKEWLKTFKLYIPILISLLVFFGIWIKLTFFWLLPGIVGMFLFELWLNKETVLTPEKKKILYKQILLCVGLVGLLCYALIYSSNPHNPHDRPLLNQILGSQSYKYQEFVHSNWRDFGIVKAFLNPLEATKRIYDVAGIHSVAYLYDFFVYLSTPLILFFLYRSNPKYKKELLVSAVFYLLFLLTVVIILRTKASFWMHHAILAFPFLVLSIVSTMSFLWNNMEVSVKSRGIVIRWVALFILLNSFFFLTFKEQPLTIRGENDPSRIKLNKLLSESELSKKYLYVVIDWGMYYYQGLYGDKNQSVLYMEPLVSIDQINQLKYLSERYHRKVLFIYDAKSPSSNMPLLYSYFPLKRWDKVDESSVWQVLIEDT